MYNGISDEISFNTEDYKLGYLRGVEDSQRKKEETKEVIITKENQSEFQKRLLDTYGSFYFNFYKRLSIEGQFLFRFIYLCSFMNYDNYLSNGRRLLRESDLQDMLLLGKSEYYKTKDYLLEKDLISIDADGLISINSKYCKKGEN